MCLSAHITLFYGRVLLHVGLGPFGGGVLFVGVGPVCLCGLLCGCGTFLYVVEVFYYMWVSDPKTFCEGLVPLLLPYGASDIGRVLNLYSLIHSLPERACVLAVNHGHLKHA